MPIVLYFVFHHEAEALRTPRFRQSFADADTILLEAAFRDEDDLGSNLYNALSRGDLLPEDIRRIHEGIGGGQPDAAFTRELVSMISHSGKTVVVENPPTSVYDAAVYDALTSQEFQNMPLGKACHLLDENLAKRAEYQKKRDEALAEQIRAMAGSNPGSKILVLRGIGHKQSLEEALTHQGVSAESVTQYEDAALQFTDELMQKLIAGGRPSRIELLRALVDQAETRTGALHPTQEAVREVRERVGGMSELQCEQYLRKKLNML